MGVASAIVGGSLISGILGNQAADEAADATRDASAASVGESRRQFDLVRGDTAPYREVGQASLYRLADIFGLPGFDSGQRRLTASEQEELSTLQALSQGRAGTGSQDEITRLQREITGTRIMANSLGGDAPVDYGAQIREMEARLAELQGQPAQMTDAQRQRFEYLQGLAQPAPSPATFRLNEPSPDQVPVTGESVADRVLQASPGYQFRLSEGMKALERNQSRYRFTPRAAKEMTRYSQGVASDEFGRFLESQFRLAGLGGNAVNTSASAGANAAAQIGAANQAAGAGAANAAMIGGQSINNAIQGGISNYMTLQAYNSLRPQATILPMRSGVASL